MISELDVVGIAEGTDKCLLRQDYLRHYERCFGHLREREFTFLEIGVLDGASLRMWRRFLPKATIVGADINPAAKRHEGDGVRIEIGSQTDPGFLAELCMHYSPLIVIDDGSHIAGDVVFTFERVFPSVASGGCYVMEDLHFHASRFGDQYVRGAPVLPRGVVADIGRCLMENERPEGGPLEKYWFDAIDRVEVVRKGALIWKRANRGEPDADEIAPLMERCTTPVLWHEFAHLLERQKKGDPRVANALRRSLELAPDRWHAHAEYSRVLGRAGCHAEAIRAAELALELAPAERRSEMDALLNSAKKSSAIELARGAAE